MSLIERIEAGTREEQILLLHEALNVLRPAPWDGAFAFCDLLGIGTDEACLGAAMMLVPEGCVFNVMTDFGLPGRARIWGSVLPGQVQDRGWQADADTPALALAAACLKAGADHE